MCRIIPVSKGKVRHDAAKALLPSEGAVLIPIDGKRPGNMHPRKCSVLLVEDEPLLLEMYSEVLTESGFSVMPASSADEAWNKVCAAVPFDILVTDVRMAGELDGVKLAYKVQAARPTIPRIMMSAYMMTDVMIEPDLAEFIRKPFTPDMLVRTIVRCLTGEQSLLQELQ